MKRGNLMDIVLTPTFTTAVVLGLVLLTLLRAIYGVGTANDFFMSFYSVDTGLLIDAGYSASPDLN